MWSSSDPRTAFNAVDHDRVSIIVTDGQRVCAATVCFYDSWHERSDWGVDFAVALRGFKTVERSDTWPAGLLWTRFPKTCTTAAPDPLKP